MAAAASDQMELDAQEKLFWSHVGPLKREPEAAKPATRNTTEAAKRQRLGPQDKGKARAKEARAKAKAINDRAHQARGLHRWFRRADSESLAFHAGHLGQMDYGQE